MTPREKALAVIVASLVGLLAVAYVGQSTYSAFTSRDRTIEGLRTQVDDAAFQVKRGLRIAEQLDAFEQQALPEEPELARSLYKGWLVRTVTDLSMKNISVEAGSVRPNGEIYDAHTFTLTGAGDLGQISRLLYEIQFAPILHRIQRITIKPVLDKKELDLVLSMDVLSMRAAPVRNELPSSKTNPSAAPLADYEKAILDRNLFAQKNQAPNLKLDETFIVHRGAPFDLTLRADDPDKLDAVRFEADVSRLPGARFTSRDGKLHWTPQANGEYPFTVIVRDDGFPNREVEKSVNITVTDPPRPTPPPAPPPPPPTFNLAKLAVVTAITEANGQSQVWVTLRNEGRTLKLGVGEKIQVGHLEGHIASIDGQHVTIAAAGGRFTAKLGDALAQ